MQTVVERYKNIFQILISDVKPSSELLENIKQRILNVYRDYNYTLYTDEDIKDFLLGYDPEVLQAYQKLKPYAYKADLTRCCLLERFGGWYFDISLYPNFYHASDKTALFFYNYEDKYIENCIMQSDPGNVFLQNAIEKIKHNVKIKHYGDNPLDITGPKTLAREFNKLDKSITEKFAYGRWHTGSTCWMPPAFFSNEPRRLTIGGRTFAFYKKRDQFGISHLGVQGTNLYNDMWKNRDVYND